MTAPATAPIGPSTTAPDTAPSAASPGRSCAIAVEDISANESTTLAIIVFIRVPGFAAQTNPFKLLTSPGEYDRLAAKSCHRADF
jgi:hypothetical protein